jgi:hypothetical protein
MELAILEPRGLLRPLTDDREVVEAIEPGVVKGVIRAHNDGIVGFRLPTTLGT